MNYQYELSEKTKEEIQEALASAPTETKERLLKLNDDIDSTMEKIDTFQDCCPGVLFPLVESHAGLVEQREMLLDSFLHK